jgi:hypothetical protein
VDFTTARELLVKQETLLTSKGIIVE